MSITLKKDQWKVKDPSTGTYRGSAIFSTTLPEDATQIVEDATDALDTQQVRAQEIVNDAQNAVNGINGLREKMIASIASVAGQGTDSTFTQRGVAADAVAVGNLKNTLQSSSMQLPFPDNYGENGQYPRSTGTGIEWVDYGLPSDEQTENAINAWLNAHPEATTTVQDHSLTYNKLVINTLGYVTPEMFGAVGDGVTDDTNAVLSALQYKNVKFDNAYLVHETKYGLSPIEGATLYGSGKIIFADAYDENTPYINLYGGCITVSEDNVTIKDITLEADVEYIPRPFTWDMGDAETIRDTEWFYKRIRTQPVIQVQNCTGFKAYNVTCYKGLTGFDLSLTDNFIIENCTAKYLFADGFFVGYGSSNGLVIGCKTFNNGDDSYSVTADSHNLTLKPHDVVISNCIAFNCRGSLICLEGSENVTAVGCKAYNNEYKPFKVGSFITNDGIAYGVNLTIRDCYIQLADMFEGDFNNKSYPVGSGIGEALYDVIVDNVTIDYRGSWDIMFYFGTGQDYGSIQDSDGKTRTEKITINNSMFIGGHLIIRWVKEVVFTGNNVDSLSKMMITHSTTSAIREGTKAIINNNIFKWPTNEQLQIYQNIVYLYNNVYNTGATRYGASVVFSDQEVFTNQINEIGDTAGSPIHLNIISEKLDMPDYAIQDGIRYEAGGNFYFFKGGNKYKIDTTYIQPST